MKFHNPKALIGNAEKAIIHIAKSDLHLSQDEYEAVLLGAAGVSSSKELTYAKYGAVLERLKELGFKVGKGKGAGKGKGKRKMDSYREPVGGKRRLKECAWGAMATPEQQATIIALWEDVARVKTHAALGHFLEGRFKVSSVRFLTRSMAIKATEALKAMKKRQDKEWDGIIG